MTRKFTFRAAVLVMALVLGAAACTRDQTADRPPEAGDRAVAKVGDWTVWASDVKREAVAQGLIGEGEPLDASSDMFRQVLDGVIDQKLLAAEAVKRKLEQDPAGRGARPHPRRCPRRTQRRAGGQRKQYPRPLSGTAAQHPAVGRVPRPADRHDH